MNTFNSPRQNRSTTEVSRASWAADSTAITVTALNRQVKSMLENSFMSIRVQGELSNFAKPSSGHWYFTLKDPTAQIRCAMFKGNNRQINFSPKEGDEVIIQAKVSLYEGRGDYQLICSNMEEAGSGKLQLAFEQLKAKLLKEGLFDARYKKSIPLVISHLGVITSPTGAAIHDVLSVLKRRFPGLPITMYPSQVQGSKAAASIIHALELAKAHKCCDLILITRGGGSLEDLWPFNEESLARHLFEYDLPVISAVGHEVDFSICDLVADYRAATPSAAAELISPDQDNLKIYIDLLQKKLENTMSRVLDYKKNSHMNLASRLKSPQQILQFQGFQLDTLKRRLLSPSRKLIGNYRLQLSLNQQKLHTQRPNYLIVKNHKKVQDLAQKMTLLFKQNQYNKRQSLASVCAVLSSLSPLSTLARGYSITQTADGKIISDSKNIVLGDTITTQLANGKLYSKVSKMPPNQT
jgi:exodeoxyribonuclease VII large subunit